MCTSVYVYRQRDILTYVVFACSTFSLAEGGREGEIWSLLFILASIFLRFKVPTPQQSVYGNRCRHDDRRDWSNRRNISSRSCVTRRKRPLYSDALLLPSVRVRPSYSLTLTHRLLPFLRLSFFFSRIFRTIFSYTTRRFRRACPAEKFTGTRWLFNFQVVARYFACVSNGVKVSRTYRRFR